MRCCAKGSSARHRRARPIPHMRTADPTALSLGAAHFFGGRGRAGHLGPLETLMVTRLRHGRLYTLAVALVRRSSASSALRTAHAGLQSAGGDAGCPFCRRCQSTHAPMPPSMPSQTKATSKDGAPRSNTQIGPGHAPPSPQPTPKSAAPATRGTSTGLLFGGMLKPSPSSGARPSRHSRTWKKGNVSNSAAPITKARLGSQDPERRSKKAATLLGLAMPLMTKPTPKAKPKKSSIRGRSVLVSTRPRRPQAAAETHASTTAALQATATPHEQPSASALVATSGGRTSAVSLRLAAKTPATMKVGTATQLRHESRAKPVRPWPLVQPFPMAVPAPIRRPAKKRRNRSNPRSEVAGGGIGSKPP
mmetsp:Transcript_26285/g.71430  ORF Transcript_26285/g.71430 Transcript_26285/m.71430 type:complete len:363 (+) Transcript_26285:250-1338(+)